ALFRQISPSSGNNAISPTFGTTGKLEQSGVLLMPTMRAVQVARPGGPFELVERPIPEPGPGTVRIKVQACGICHSDVMTKEGQWPGIAFPRVPGHEVIGAIDA